MLYEIAIIILLAIICFLLYRLYRIKYTGSRVKTEFIPENLKKDLANLDDNRNKETEMMLKDVNNRISEIERKIEKNERVVEKLIEELG
jgi:uncharacterized protein YicC (UPF0701 family)